MSIMQNITPSRPDAMQEHYVLGCKTHLSAKWLILKTKNDSGQSCHQKNTYSEYIYAKQI